MSHTDAMEYLGEDYRQPRAEKAQVIKVKNTQATYKFMYETALQYHDFLMETPGALRYLYSRGLTDDTIRRYKLGYTDGRVLRLSYAWESALAIEAGIINRNNYEILSHRITIPNLTDEYQCDFMVGRTVTSDKIKYLGLRVPKPIHGFYEVRHSPLIFLAEGQFDWLTLRQWGYPAAVVGGTHLSRSNLLLLQGKKVVVVPDLDESGIGQSAAKKIAEQLGESATILDYSELQTGTSKLDISSLAENPGGELLFKTIVNEELPWISFMSQRVLRKWCPALVTAISSPST
jgi:DNA primase